MAKQIKSPWYTETKTRWNHGAYETIHNNGCLFAKGEYKTKITVSDLPEWYKEIWIRGKVYVCAKDISDIVYKPNWFSDNHLFKDDFLYICWNGKKLRQESVDGRYVSCEDYDMLLHGWAVKDFVEEAIPYAEGEMKSTLEDIQRRINDKIAWYIHMNPERNELGSGFQDIKPKVTFILRDMSKFKRPLSETEQIEAMENFCVKHNCVHIGTLKLYTEEDVRKLAMSLPELKIDTIVRPIFLYVSTSQYIDNDVDAMERMMFRYIFRNKANIHQIFVRKLLPGEGDLQ